MSTTFGTIPQYIYSKEPLANVPNVTVPSDPSSMALALANNPNLLDYFVSEAAAQDARADSVTAVTNDFGGIRSLVSNSITSTSDLTPVTATKPFNHLGKVLTNLRQVVLAIRAGTGKFFESLFKDKGIPITEEQGYAIYNRIAQIQDLIETGIEQVAAQSELRNKGLGNLRDSVNKSQEKISNLAKPQQK